jgi:hypothetical protein
MVFLIFKPTALPILFLFRKEKEVASYSKKKKTMDFA